MGSYNGWDAPLGIREFRKFNLAHYYGPTNPNTGGDAFRYRYGWEGSHVVYIDAVFYLGLKVLNGDWKYYTEMTQQMFRDLCQHLGDRTHADENSVSEESRDSISWRLWWD